MRAAALGIGVGLAGAAAWWLVPGGPAIPPGSLTVTSRPAGAQFLVDGRNHGPTPATVAVAPGAHTLEIRSSGPTQIIGFEMASGGQVSRYFDLPSGTAGAQLQVLTRPAAAMVTVDGQVRGRSPLVVADLNPGPHRVRVSLGAQSLERTVMMESGANGAVTLTFDNPNVTPSPGHGFLAVSTPVEVRGFENGMAVGTSRALPWQLTAGTHDIEFVNDSLGVRERQPVTIVDGRVQSLDVAVAPAMLTVTATDGATLVVDGQALGTALIKHPVTAGQHDVVARHPVLGERRLLVTLMPGGSADVRIVLTRE